jgi:hypothetical protein
VRNEVLTTSSAIKPIIAERFTQNAEKKQDMLVSLWSAFAARLREKLTTTRALSFNMA